VPHLRPDGEPDVDACLPGLRFEAEGIGEEYLIGSDLDEEAGQAPEIAVVGEMRGSLGSRAP
jgi:hypothetical protein